MKLKHVLYLSIPILRLTAGCKSERVPICSDILWHHETSPLNINIASLQRSLVFLWHTNIREFAVKSQKEMAHVLAGFAGFIYKT